jgi:hypothetical protein
VQLKSSEAELLALAKRHNEETLRLETKLADKTAEAESLSQQLKSTTLRSEEALGNMKLELEQTKYDLEKRLTYRFFSLIYVTNSQVYQSSFIYLKPNPIQL